MSDMLINFQYDPEQDNYIYSFRMSAEKKLELAASCSRLDLRWKRQFRNIWNMRWNRKKSPILQQLKFPST